MYKEIAFFSKKLGSTVEFNAPMKRYTSFKCGGKATLLIIPNSVSNLISIVEFCRKFSFEPLVIGNGSNILVTDNGVGNVVIKVGREVGKIELIDDTTINCEAGASLKSLCLFALDNSLSGLEFAYGIPGTLGGAIYMNAGAYGGEMKDVLESVTCLDSNCNVVTIPKEELGLGYRKSVFTDSDYTILSATLKLKKADKNEVKEAMDDKLKRRKEKQPLEFGSAGSTFKRPEGHFAGALIEECGLKGYKIGGAQVSEKHAGFIINKNRATSTDVIKLIKHVQKTVYEKHGVMLETEVKIIGK